jgi:hypothetical protein
MSSEPFFSLTFAQVTADAVPISIKGSAIFKTSVISNKG